MNRILVVLVAACACLNANAQRKSSYPEMIKPPQHVVCYASTVQRQSVIGPPAEYLRSRNGAARTQSTNIEVTYDGFTPDAKAAFQAAVDIWASIIQSPVTIRITAHWTKLGSGVLGSASPSTYYRNFAGARKKNVWYPIALAEKIAGQNFNDLDSDIEASFNSDFSNWHLGTAGSNPPADKYDLMSVVLHEIGHGLGITDGYTISAGAAVIPDYFSGMPVIYETNIITGTGKNFVNDFPLPSTDLRNAIVGGVNSLQFTSPLVTAANGGNTGVLYSPNPFSSGSSIAHLDESTYPQGNPNSLMSPQFGMGERILDPGPISRNILNEEGWTSTRIQHTPLTSTENTTAPLHVVAKIISDGYNANSVTLSYKTTGKATTIPMSPTGNADEFAADIPTGAGTYSYYIQVVSTDTRSFTNPGVIIKPGSLPQQDVITFEVGPDTKAPVIRHTPKEFVINSDTKLDIQAIVSDNLGVGNVIVEWKFNGGSLNDVPMTLKAGTDSTYESSITLPALTNGDKIEYRIRAEDTSIAKNVAFLPSASTFFTVNVTGLGETIASYSNNFDDLSGSDFFGSGFTVTKPSNFDNGAIHSTHPYPAGGAADTHVDLIYNLKNPIRIAAENAVLKFDEIVLVEPGVNGVAWPGEDFFDYVVVEGSVDGGVTWQAIADGYDSRANSTWLNLWNSTTDNSGNSTGAGAPSLYQTHTFNLLTKYSAGDEVAFRFRLYSDPFANGWGWAIDNLKIQIDDVAPTILHQQVDYAIAGKDFVNLTMNVKDASGLSDLHLDYSINGGTPDKISAILSPAVDDYTIKLDLVALGVKTNDKITYSIEATDNSGNVGTFGPIDLWIISFDNPLTQLSTDFESEPADIIGNFFTIAQPSAFISKGMNSEHNYRVGVGVDHTSDFSWMTKKPITIATTNSIIYYEDVAIVQPNGAENDIQDYVVVEGSKDGIEWKPIVAPYAANAYYNWLTAYRNNTAGNLTLIQKHIVDLTTSGNFKAGDKILVRFRLHSDISVNSWGWYVDNLSIQGPTTGLEKSISDINFEAWPNPIANGSLNLKFALPSASDVSVDFLTTQGQLLSNDRFSAPSGDSYREYAVSDWADGLYIVRIKTDLGTVVKKIIKTNSQK